MPLTDSAIRSLEANGSLIKRSDGNGLYFVITAKGVRFFRFDYRFGGKQKSVSLGTYPETSLRRAREKRDAERRLLADGVDPSAARQSAKQHRDETLHEGETLHEIADAWFQDVVLIDPRSGAKLDADDRSKRVARERSYIKLFKTAIANKPVTSVITREISDLLMAVHQQGNHEKRSRMQSTIDRIMAYAIGRGVLMVNPVSAIKANQTQTFKRRKAKRRDAITDPLAFGQMMRKIDHYEDRTMTGVGLKLLALTAVRPGTLQRAEWAEFDFADAEWIIPFSRVKMRTQRAERGDESPFIVPLSQQALALLHDLRKITGRRRFLFPGGRGNRFISENTFNLALKALGYDGLHHPHGFRSSFSTLMNNERRGGRLRTGLDENVIELCIDHRDEKLVRFIYDRGECLPERAEVMQYWADYIDRMRDQSDVVARFRRAI